MACRGCGHLWLCSPQKSGGCGGSTARDWTSTFQLVGRRCASSLSEAVGRYALGGLSGLASLPASLSWSLAIIGTHQQVFFQTSSRGRSKKNRLAGFPPPCAAQYSAWYLHRTSVDEAAMPLSPLKCARRTAQIWLQHAATSYLGSSLSS